MQIKISKLLNNTWKKKQKMYLVVCRKLHESQSGQISGYFIKLRKWGQSLPKRKWLLHWAKRRSNTAGSETGQSASFYSLHQHQQNRETSEWSEATMPSHQSRCEDGHFSTSQQYGTIAQYQTLKN